MRITTLARRVIICPQHGRFNDHLPFASPEGDYEIDVLDSKGKQYGVHTIGRALLKDGRTLVYMSSGRLRLIAA